MRMYKRAASAFGATGSKVLSLCVPLCVRVTTNLGAGEKDGRAILDYLPALATVVTRSLRRNFVRLAIQKEITTYAHTPTIHIIQKARSLSHCLIWRCEMQQDAAIPAVLGRKTGGLKRLFLVYLE